MWLAQGVVYALIALAVWTLLSGLDDLFISLFWVATAGKPFPWPAERDLVRTPERPIAVLVPLWHEHNVIRQMLIHNLTAIRYGNFQIFTGVYPNDQATRQAVEAVERAHGEVHLALAGHDGPTSKADCLNAIHREMEAYELRHGVRFEVIVIHDAEDLIHPESFRLINWHIGKYQMVQVPVLALPTPSSEFTHGLYCDEFAEFQQKDIPVRQRLGGFLPSNGVGTGFSRDALDQIAARRGGMMFNPDCLTEDYETGLTMHEMGYRQIFLPVRFDSDGPIATREYFPRGLRAAVRQRSRWVAGIALQGWRNHGWRLGTRQTYWLWRDRKGLIGNLLSPVTNVLFLAGTLDGDIRHLVPDWLLPLYAATAVITLAQAAIRVAASAHVYGWRFASGAPFRVFWGNLVNCLATATAVQQFTLAALRREALAWRKTEHVYPAYTPATRPRLGEVLLRMRALPVSDLEDALRSQPDGLRLGEYLRRLDKISEEHLWVALDRQQSGD